MYYFSSPNYNESTVSYIGCINAAGLFIQYNNTRRAAT